MANLLQSSEQLTSALLRSMFDLFDEERTGLITLEECVTLIRSLFGLRVSSENVSLALKNRVVVRESNIHVAPPPPDQSTERIISFKDFLRILPMDEKEVSFLLYLVFQILFV